MQELGVHALNLVKPHTLLNGQIPHRNKPSPRLKLFHRVTFEFLYSKFKQQRFSFYWQQNEQISLTLTLTKQFKILQIITFLNKTISKFTLKRKRTFLEARLLKSLKRFYIVSEAQSLPCTNLLEHVTKTSNCMLKIRDILLS